MWHGKHTQRCSASIIPQAKSFVIQTNIRTLDERTFVSLFVLEQCFLFIQNGEEKKVENNSNISLHQLPKNNSLIAPQNEEQRRRIHCTFTWRLSMLLNKSNWKLKCWKELIWSRSKVLQMRCRCCNCLFVFSLSLFCFSSSRMEKTDASSLSPVHQAQ